MEAKLQAQVGAPQIGPRAALDSSRRLCCCVLAVATSETQYMFESGLRASLPTPLSPAAAPAARRSLPPPPFPAHPPTPFPPSRPSCQVRGLTRDVGALREALRQEEKKRERLAAAAKAAEDARAAAEAQLKQVPLLCTCCSNNARSGHDSNR